MSLAIYMDHNVIGAITDGCRATGLDVLTAISDLELICRVLTAAEMQNQLIRLPLS